MKPILSIIRRMFASNRVSFILTIAVVICATSSGDSKSALSNGNYTWILAAMSPFFFVYYDYSRLVCLGASKKEYALSSLASYALLALLISAVNTVFFYLIDPLNHTQNVINLMEVCKWSQNGVFVAFLQQFFFLAMVMLFLHVLLFIQPYWYGWLTDAVLIAIIAVFTPIAPLRRILAGFFRLIMLNGNALVHIAVCLLISLALFGIEIWALKRKTL